MIYQALTNSFRLELAQRVHDLSTDVLKLALYDTTASLNELTTAYTATGECSGSGYSAGGITLTQAVSQDSDGTVLVDFADATFSAVSITARGGMIYNSTRSNKSILVIDFGLAISRSGTDFVVRFPEPDSQNAIIRIR